MKAKGWSIPATSRAVFGELDGLDWNAARVLDVGAGRGAFSKLVGDFLERERQLSPKGRIFACDAIPSSFEYEGIACEPLAAGGKLPYPDAHFDACVSIEVIEHVEDQFEFLREIARVTKPGGRIVVTTPNTLHLVSRVRTLCTGFPTLYDPLPLSSQDTRLLSGHIHPISPYFLAYGALRAGLEPPRLLHDRSKASAALLAVLLAPFLLGGHVLHRARLARKQPRTLDENRALLAAQSSWGLLTGRTAILSTRRPAR